MLELLLQKRINSPQLLHSENFGVGWLSARSRKSCENFGDQRFKTSASYTTQKSKLASEISGFTISGDTVIFIAAEATNKN